MSYITFEKTNGDMYDGKSPLGYYDIQKYLKALYEKALNNHQSGKTPLDDIDFPPRSSSRRTCLGANMELFVDEFRKDVNAQSAIGAHLLNPSADASKAFDFMNSMVSWADNPNIEECTWLKNNLYNPGGILEQRINNARSYNLPSGIDKLPAESIYELCMRSEGNRLETLLKLDNLGKSADNLNLSDKILTPDQTKKLCNKLMTSMDRYPASQASNKFMFRLAYQSDMSELTAEEKKNLDDKFKSYYPGDYNKIMADLAPQVLKRVAKETSGRNDIENNTGIYRLANKAEIFKGGTPQQIYAYRLRKLRGVLTPVKETAQLKAKQNTNNININRLTSGGMEK